MDFPGWEPAKWTGLERNPLIAPVETDRPDGVIGDPQVILPGEFDEEWHLFCIGRGHFYRFDSKNGVEWSLAYNYFWNSGPACVTCDGKKWIACYSRHKWPESPDSSICLRTSKDLVNWSEPVEILRAELAWELEGGPKQVRNPNLAVLPDGSYRLYYSGGTVWMHDMNFEEPKYIGMAESSNLEGPYVKKPQPLLRPELGKAYRNYGAGAMKTFKYGDAFLALSNGIYLDEERRTRSAIDVLMSKDGERWTDAPYNPIVSPSGSGWQSALIYQLDLRWFEGRLWLFYNAREGWAGAKEWIGCATLPWNGPKPEKLWLPMKA